MANATDWPALMRLGLVELRLTPDQFWALTPAELIFLAGGGAARQTIGRAGFEALLSRFPDRAPSDPKEQPNDGQH